VNKYDWLLFLHVTGAFLFLGAAVVALVFSVASLRRDRPSEIVLLLRLNAQATVGLPGSLPASGFS
jgi:heme A synthase